jgi:hypothetical protein
MDTFASYTANRTIIQKIRTEISELEEKIKGKSTWLFVIAGQGIISTLFPAIKNGIFNLPILIVTLFLVGLIVAGVQITKLKKSGFILAIVLLAIVGIGSLIIFPVTTLSIVQFIIRCALIVWIGNGLTQFQKMNDLQSQLEELVRETRKQEEEERKSVYARVLDSQKLNIAQANPEQQSTIAQPKESQNEDIIQPDSERQAELAKAEVSEKMKAYHKVTSVKRQYYDTSTRIETLERKTIKSSLGCFLLSGLWVGLLLFVSVLERSFWIFIDVCFLVGFIVACILVIRLNKRGFVLTLVLISLLGVRSIIAILLALRELDDPLKLIGAVLVFGVFLIVFMEKNLKSFEEIQYYRRMSDRLKETEKRAVAELQSELTETQQESSNEDALAMDV